MSRLCQLLCWVSLLLGFPLFIDGEQADPAKDPRARTDQLGDPLPAGAVARLGTLRYRHQAQVYTVAFAPDGKTLATGGHDRTIRLWDTATGKEIRNWIGHANFVYCVAFSPDGKRLASVGGDAQVRLWDPDTGKEVRSIKAHKNSAYAVAFSPDGKLLASGGAYDDHTVGLWDLEGKLLHRFEEHDGYVNSVAFSPDGKELASGCDSGRVHVHEVASGKLVGSSKGNARGICWVAFFPDGKTLALAGGDSLIKVLDADRNGPPQERCTGHQALVRSLAFSPDGKRLVSGSWDHTVRIWDVNTGEQQRLLTGHRDSVHAVAFSPDGSLIASAGYDWTVRLWDANTGKLVRICGTPQGWFSALAYSPDGKIAASGSSEGVLQLWDPATGKEQARLEGHTDAITRVVFSSDGKRLVSGSKDRTIRVWDRATGRELMRLDGHERPVLAVVLLADGKTIVSACEGGTARRWDANSGRQLGQPVKLPEPPTVVALSGDGKLFAAISGQIRCWDVAANREVLRYRSTLSHLRSMVLSEDGRTLVTCNENHEIVHWETATGGMRSQYLSNSTARTLALSPNGRLVASDAYTALHLQDVDANKEVHRSQPHLHHVLSIAFAPNGKTFISGSRDATGLVWDVEALAPRKPTPAKELDAAALDVLWSDLAGADARKSFAAHWALIAAPGQAVPLLEKKLRDHPLPDARRIAQLIADLDADEFTRREQASAELEKLGDLAVPALAKILEDARSLEQKRRAEELLEKLAGRGAGPVRLTVLRSLEVLERIATPEARQIFERLAKGPPEDWLTLEAKGALQRLALGAETPP